MEFVQWMLHWRPEHRLTAKQLLDHPWLKALKSMELLTHGVKKETLTVAHPCPNVGLHAPIESARKV